METKQKHTATFIKNLKGFTGTAKLWRVKPKLEGNSHVVTSATVAFYRGPETYIFGSDAKGKVSNWGELEGSAKGTLDHAEAIERAGYKIISKAKATNS